MLATSFNAAFLILSLAMVWTCSGQASLGETQTRDVLQKVLASLGARNGTNETSAGNDTSLDRASPTPEQTPAPVEASTIPGLLSSIFGFMFPRGHSVGLDVNSGSPDSTARTTPTISADNFDVSQLAKRFWDLNENASVSAGNTTPAAAPTSDGATTGTTAIPGTTSGLPETPSGRHMTETATGGGGHRPDVEGDANPSTKPVDEPEDVEQGNLPLVLGAAIVVIFGVGVSGAAISSACRRRKMAGKDTASETSDSDVDVERGIDNPMFSSKSTSNLNLVSSAFPTNFRTHREMRFASPTMPL